MVLYKYVYIYLFIHLYNFHIFINIDESRSGQVVIGGHIYNHNHTSQKIATVGQSVWQKKDTATGQNNLIGMSVTITVLI